MTYCIVATELCQGMQIIRCWLFNTDFEARKFLDLGPLGNILANQGARVYPKVCTLEEVVLAARRRNLLVEFI